MNIRRPQSRFPRRAQERGAVLFVALIFLILLTLLAIGASSGSLLQQRMVAATRSAQLATLSGDTALRGAEWKLWSSASMVGAVFECSADAINATTGCVKYDPQSPLYGAAGAVTEFRTGNNAWLSLVGPVTYTGANGAGFTGTSGSVSSASPSVAQNPQYIVEDMGLVKPPGAGPQHESGVSGPNIGGAANGGAGQISIRIYRITARATGGNQNTVRVVQSTFDAQASN
jgi:type IV pilus assembly protein PilX